MSRQSPTEEEMKLLTELVQRPSPSDRLHLQSLVDTGERLYFTWKQFKSVEKRLSLMLAAAKALQMPIPSDSPGEPIARMATFLDLWSDLIPPPYNIWSSLIGEYSTVLRLLATKLNAISRNIEARDIAGGNIAHFSGKVELRTFIATLIDPRTTKASDLAPVLTQDVVNWYLENAVQLSLLAGDAPSIQKKYFLGIDWLKPDDVDRNALRDWFYNNKDVVKHYKYGSARVELYS